MSLICGSCGRENTERTKFCTECGAALVQRAAQAGVRRSGTNDVSVKPENIGTPAWQTSMDSLCPSCGNMNKAGRKFCNSCGAALKKESKSAAAGQYPYKGNEPASSAGKTNWREKLQNQTPRTQSGFDGFVADVKSTVKKLTDGSDVPVSSLPEVAESELVYEQWAGRAASAPEPERRSRSGKVRYTDDDDAAVNQTARRYKQQEKEKESEGSGLMFIYGIFGFLLGIPMSYYFQPSYIRDKVPFSKYIEAVPSFFSPTAGEAQKMAEMGIDLTTPVIISCLIFTILGLVAGRFWDKKN